MSLKTVFILATIVAGFFALGCLLIPATMLSWYGVESSDALVLISRFYGAALLAIALITFNLKNSELNADVKSVVFALLIFNVVGAIVALWGQVSNIFNTLGWSIVIIFVFFTIAYLPIYLKK
jgi:hypothetical protein